MIETKTRDSLEYLTAEGICVPHCFTTRLGGVSRGHLESLNIGTSRGDDPENVLENYRRLGSCIGFDVQNVVLSHQTHSDIVRTVSEKDRGAGLFAPHLEECDALITNTPGLALVIFTADCTPILFWDTGTGAVGAAHAGWRYRQRHCRPGGGGHGALLRLPAGGHPGRHRPQHRPVPLRNQRGCAPGLPGGLRGGSGALDYPGGQQIPPGSEAD